MSSKRIRAVFFDVHDTLIYCRSSAAEIFFQLCQELGVPVPLKEVEKAYETIGMPDDQLLHKQRGREDAFWLEFDSQILRQLGRSDSSRKLARSLAEGFKEVRWWSVYPDVLPALDDLQHAGYALGVIANARRLVAGRLAYLNLTGYFQTITYSEEIGFEKPNPEIFRAALQRTKCRAEEAVHIGDRLVEDVEGALAAGIQPILLDRKGLYRSVDCARVETLAELPDRLRVMDSRS